MKPRNKTLWQRFLASPVALVFLSIIFIFLSVSVYRLTSKSIEVSDRLKETEERLTKAVANKASISEEIKYLSTEGGVEAELRKKYHATSPGENVAVVIDTSTSTNADGAVLGKNSGGSLWQRFTRAIGF